jgi:uncharacterized protein (TIGR04141 family)
VRDYAINNFGIDLACKSLNPNELNHLYQKTPTGNVYGLSRSLRGKYIPSNDPINQRSVLKALKGKVINQELGITMEGRTSLAISGKKSLNDVIKFLNELIKLEQSNIYTVKIKGLDEVSKELREILETKLLNEIDNEDFNNCLFGYNDDLVFKNCDKLIVGIDKTEYLMDDMQSVFESAKKQRSDNLSGVKIRGLDDQNQDIFNKKLIDLIEGELDYRGDKYFRIDKR